MDERSVVPFALAAGEVGGSLAVVLAVQDPIARGPWLQFAGNHALFTLGFWILIAIGGYMLGPTVWRKRRSLKSKLIFLGTIWIIAVVAENTLLINLTADLTAGVGWGAIPTSELWIRTGSSSACYWGTIVIWFFQENRRRSAEAQILTSRDRVAE